MEDALERLSAGDCGLPHPTSVMPTSQIPITNLLRQGAFGEVVPVVYPKLHRIAKRKMDGERVGHILQPTALVNEAYLRLIDWNNLQWQSRTHFYAACAKIMKNVLADYRKRKGPKPWMMVPLDEAIAALRHDGFDLLHVNEALEALRKINRRQADVLVLRYFVGLSVTETAEVLEVSPQTIFRDLHFAKLWCLHYMKGHVKDDACKMGSEGYLSGQSNSGAPI